MEVVDRFVNDLLADGLNKGRIARYVYDLKRTRKEAGVPLIDMTEKDTRRVMRIIRDAGLSEWTVHFFVVTLKKFYKWLNGGEYPENVAWLKASPAKNNEVTSDMVP